MNINVRFSQLLALMLCACCSLASARDLGQDEALRLRERGEILPLEDILKFALERYPDSKLLEVELEEKQGAYVYEVELVTPQRVVRELKFNASSGNLTKDKEDD
ncbi:MULTISPECIES: PepSY domain-containing protein [Pseudomonas]|jgi:uncharacterized membrane protein YkoI|uniref:Peptidase n=1 Tax=Pseudomonas weihenstephanensis TaxID=1608994 RepID=A0ABS1ZP83_9PSED|nr:MULTISPECIES: PepSY domain-containing protein [Pseudomonas]KVV08455.1 Peptidase propeptide and YPEB domain protein [Pseudomonas sp. TAD18]KVV09511.1 Peptidase propeptide and YPEB domain protein [Pseudomonas sp. TAA207]MBM1197796.1 peptidase [Pseudomonas weihenstephanensis]